jgi:PAS domain S-box-containing protein/putative nucleotidyltransferase with HDIG domain
MRVLYVEDDPRDADLTRRALHKQAPQLHLSIARTQGEALKLLEDAPDFDVLITDLRLPDGDGFALLSYVRGRGLPIAVVVATGQGDEEIAVAALKAGANDYVVKRQDYLKHLPLILENALQRFQTEAERRIRPLRVLYLEQNSTDIDLTRRYFASHAPHIHLEIAETMPDLLKRLPGKSNPASYDAVMVDYQSPGLNALEILKELRQGRDLDLPVVLVAGHGDDEVAAQALRLGANDYVVKSPGYLFQLPGLLENAYHRVQLTREQVALQASEARFRRLAENAQDIIYRYRLLPTAGFDYINPAATTVTGYPREDFYADPDLVYKLVHSEDHVLLQEALNGQFPRGTAVIMRWVRKDGTLLWAEARYASVYDEANRLIAVEVIARDITERKQAEEMVFNIARGVSAATGEEFFRSLVVHLGKMLKADRVFVGELYGEKQDSIHTIAVYTDGEITENFGFRLANTPCEDVIQTGTCSHLSDVSKHFSLDQRLIEPGIEAYVGTPLADSAGRALGLMAVLYRQPIRDATLAVSMLQIFGLRASAELDRRQIEAALQASERRFRALIENNADGISLLDREGHILYSSPAAERIFGCTKNAPWSSSAFDLLHPDDYRPVTQAFTHLVQQPGGSASQEARFRHKSGRYRWIEATGVNSLDDPAIQGIVVNFRDITERKQAEENLQRQVQRLNALRTVDMAITASLDLRVTLSVLLENVTLQLGVTAAAILLLNPHTQTLEYSAARGFRSRRIERVHLRLGEGFSGRVAFERRTIHFLEQPEAVKTREFSHFLSEEGFATYYGTPLIAKGQVKGVLEIYHRALLDPDPEWIGFFETLANQAAIAIDNAELFESLQRANLELTLAYDTTLEGWVRALDLRDKETEGHTQRVAETTLKLARAMGFSEAALVHIRRGALLHDIGKMAVPDKILNKPARLDEDEWEIIRKHPVYAQELLSPITYLRSALDIPYCHHEKWDGTGYPQGLRGEQIPLAARIFAVVDVWDALSYDRVYHQGWEPQQVLDYIRSQSGIHFDPQVVEKFLQIINAA